MMVRDEGGRKGKEQGRGKPRPYYIRSEALPGALMYGRGVLFKSR